MELYHRFAREVISSFLSDDKRGEFVSLVIDDLFMSNVATILGVETQSILAHLRAELFNCYRFFPLDDYSVISIVAYQLYAASTCVTDEGGYSANAYNPRLFALISEDNQYLEKWYKNYQDAVWAYFYRFCSNNGFVIKQCSPRPNQKGRFVQYPLSLAKHTFNREDFKYISYVFQKAKVYMDEDIRYTDFWKLFDIGRSFSNLSNHCTRILESIYADTHSYDIAKSQIYNHFLTWNGEYKDPLSSRSRITATPNDKQISISNKSGIYEVYVRNRETEELINKITINRNILTSLNAHYKLKRDGLIVFQQNNDYPNVWNETRYIESRDTRGLAIVINKPYQLGCATQIYCCDNVCLYEFGYNEQTRKYYSDESQTYELIGGLKIARQIYLSNGAPILRLHCDSYYLLNNKTVNQTKGDHFLDLGEGEYTFKFQRRREFRITIVPPSPSTKEWSDKFCKWELSRKKYIWASRRDIEGIVGLDYRIYSATSNLPPILQRWVKAHQGEIVNDNKNVILKSLNSQNRHE
jgi:hypothetical protein